MPIPSTRKPINPSFRPCRPRLFLLFALASFALSPAARALLPPPAPDGGYSNANTAEGENALFNLTTGISNTAVGYQSLGQNTTGYWNTASGTYALGSNTSGAYDTATGNWRASTREVNGLKIRWAVNGPCRFESGHRQVRCASLAGKCENFRFAQDVERKSQRHE
jgi:hypothetical protein